MTPFESLVYEMRHAQKMYFKTKPVFKDLKKYWLVTSKEFEKQVDQYLKNINEPKMDL